MHRVVVTGMAGITALGHDWPTVCTAFQSGRSAIVTMPEWSRYPDLNTRLGGPITDFSTPRHWRRKQLRSMGRVSQLAVAASEMALENAGLSGEASIADGRMGVACGSSTGSTDDIRAFASLLINGSSDEVNANTYIRMMPHTTAANVGIFFGLKGRIIPTSSACTSGSQGIGYAYETIRHGQQAMMLAGGAEELCPSEAFVFDALYATSQKNDAPKTTPRPYDVARDGLVIGEGAGMLVLESLDHAMARDARIHAEIVGFGSNSDGTHVTRPEVITMQRAMELALADAKLDASQIGYVNGHGTATEQGDIAETQATQQVFGTGIPISSQKSFLGHTLGACGALESWFSIEMMNQGWFSPTLNLSQVDPRCGELAYITGPGLSCTTQYVMTNNFAFAGINTSLIFRRWR